MAVPSTLRSFRVTLSALAAIVAAVVITVAPHAVPTASAATMTMPTTAQLADRAFMKAFYKTWFATTAPAIGWTGSNGCNGGTTSAALRDDELTRINAFRALAGVPPVVTEAAEWSVLAQNAAMMNAANASISHTPPSNWACWSATNSSTVLISNLAVGVTGRNAIDLYMAGSANPSIGTAHRAVLLWPQLTTVGVGDVGVGSTYNVVRALDAPNKNGGRPTVRDGQGLVAWPPCGAMLPYQLLPAEMWSLSKPGLATVGTTVSVTKNGAPLAASWVRHRDGDTTMPEQESSFRVANPTTKPAQGVVDEYRYTIGTQASCAFSTFDVNDPPSAASPNNGAAVENAPAGTVISPITASDPEGGPVTLSLVSDPAFETDVYSFALAGGVLTTAIALDYEFQPEYHFVVRVTDADGAFTDTPFTVRLRDVADAPTPDPSRFVPIAPTRVLDTRPESSVGSSGAKPGQGGVVELTVAGVGGVPANASAVVLNVAATEAAAAGFVTAWPTGSTRPTAANLNLEYAGQTISNSVVVKVGTGGRISLFTQTGTHFVVDVAGAFVPVAGASRDGRLQSVEPYRLLDTRAESFVGYSGPKPAPDSTVRVQVTGTGSIPAAGVAAVVLNVAVTEADAAGFVTAWASGTQRPLAASVNAAIAGQTISNQVIVPVGADGGVMLYTQGGAHLVVDASGWFTDATAPAAKSGLFVPIVPGRVLDTRSGPKPNAGQTVTANVGGRLGVPLSGVMAVAANVTAVDTAAPGFMSAWPALRARPFIATLNADRAGQVIPNATTVPTGGPAAFNLFTQLGTHFVADVSGWYRR